MFLYYWAQWAQCKNRDPWKLEEEVRTKEMAAQDRLRPGLEQEARSQRM